MPNLAYFARAKYKNVCFILINRHLQTSLERTHSSDSRPRYSNQRQTERDGDSGRSSSRYSGVRHQGFSGDEKDVAQRPLPRPLAVGSASPDPIGTKLRCSVPHFSSPRPRLCGGGDTGEGDLQGLGASNPLTPALSPQSRGDGEELALTPCQKLSILNLMPMGSASPYPPLKAPQFVSNRLTRRKRGAKIAARSACQGEAGLRKKNSRRTVASIRSKKRPRVFQMPTNSDKGRHWREGQGRHASRTGQSSSWNIQSL